MAEETQSLELLRRQVPVANTCVYLDCAYDCGGTTFARDAALRYFDEWQKSAALCERGGPGRQSFFDIADQTRQMICRLIGASNPAEVCFTRNTNEGISHILMGYGGFDSNSNIITADIEHPSVLMPCLNAAKLRGFECRVLSAIDGEYLPPELYMSACDENTKMIVLSHVQSSNGYKTDLAALGTFCQERGIWLIVDAIQSVGFSPFHAELWNVAAVSAGGYKGLMAGESCAFLWCRGDLLEDIWPTYTAAGAVMSVDKDSWQIKCSDPRSARKLENSSLDAPGIYMLNAGIKRVLDIGTDAIYRHIRTLYATLYSGLKDMGISPVTPESEAQSAAAIAFNIPDKQAFWAHMSKNGIVFTNSRLLRLSIGAFTNASDIAACLAAAQEYLNNN